MTELKEDLGQVWTPGYIAEEMLENVGYVDSHSDILDKKIMEPSFGNGAFLYKIIERLIQCSINTGKVGQEIAHIIDENVYGIEYDEETYSSTLNSLKVWLKEKYKLECSLPHLYCMDALDYKIFNHFDYVIGNPPYIRVHDMPEEMRQKIKTYIHSTGNSDLYIIFFEIGLNMLNAKGKLAYITPNSWLRNTSQKKFRKNLIEEQQVVKIVNFNAEQVFDKVGTYTCISYLSKGSEKEMTYVDASKALAINYTRTLSYADEELLSADILAFSSEDDQFFLNSMYQKEGATLGDVCRIQNGILTLGNTYFLIDSNDERYTHLGVEDFVYPAVKGTKYKGTNTFQKMIFPYHKNPLNNRFEGITEELLAKHSEIFDFLTKNKEKLEKRSLEKGSLWFWYRNQSVQETDKRKLVFNHIVGPQQEKVSAYIIPANTLVYGGFFVTEQETNDLFSSAMSLEEVQKIIESPDFIRYVRIVGKDMNGGYKEFSTVHMKKFRF